MGIWYIYKTKMEKIPSNCSICPIWQSGRCTLPDKADMEIRKKYRIKRHEKCPLMEVKNG